MIFAFMSSDANSDDKYHNGCELSTIRIQGQSCHLIGSLLPPEGQPSQFARLYIYDTKNEVHNHMNAIR